MNTPHDLNERLAREADDFFRRGGTELEIGQVLDRAGEIRRGRRMRATLLMAACLLAVVVPLGVAALDHDRSRREPVPAAPVRRTLVLEGLPTGTPPRSGYAQGPVWHQAGTAIALTAKPSRLDSVVPLDAGLLVGTVDRRGSGWTTLVRTDGTPASATWRSQGRLVVSPDGRLAAFIHPDGQATVVDGRDGSTTDLPRPRGSAFSYGIGAVTGTSCSGGDSCSVLTITTHRSSSRNPETWVVSSDGSQRALERIELAWAVSKSGAVAGVTKLREDTSTCSEVQDAQGSRLWSTCDHTLPEFSPDGRRVLAGPAYLDGEGSRDVSVLDAETGRAVLDLQFTDQSLAARATWEDDRHLLVTVHEAGRWAVVRVGLDGAAEIAVPPVTGTADRSPFVLPSR